MTRLSPAPGHEHSSRARTEEAPPAATPSQTVGPFFGHALPYGDGPRVVPEWHPDAIRIHGRVLDGAGDPLPDALVEIWQADADGDVPGPGGAWRRAGGG